MFSCEKCGLLIGAKAFRDARKAATKAMQSNNLSRSLARMKEFLPYLQGSPLQQDEHFDVTFHKDLDVDTLKRSILEYLKQSGADYNEIRTENYKDGYVYASPAQAIVCAWSVHPKNVHSKPEFPPVYITINQDSDFHTDNLTVSVSMHEPVDWDY
jgi:hypothetical protein